MGTDNIMSNKGLRIITTKKGTYVIWYDSMSRAVRRLNVSKSNYGICLGIGGRQRG